MRTAVFQFGSTENIDDNFAAIKRGISQAVARKVRLLVFHECAACGYPPTETPDIGQIDFGLLQRRIEEIKDLAKRHELFIAVGTILRTGHERSNSILLINPQGAVAGSYAKRALWGWDMNHFTKGGSLGIFDIDGVRVGFRICFEVRFPEYFRELFREKVDLCFVCFSDTSEKEAPGRYALIQSHLRTRAAENVMTIISVNSTSHCQTAPTAVFDIDGGIVMQAPEGKEHLMVYDYEKPEIGFGARGRIENALRAMQDNLPN